MDPMNAFSDNMPVHHTQKIKTEMNHLIAHLREDIGKITDPKAQALFETSAEVLTGLVKAFGDYGKKCEEAWRAEPLTFHQNEPAPHAPR